MNRSTGFAVMLCVVSLLVASSVFAEPRYYVTDLGVLPDGNKSQATGLKDNGTIIGRSNETMGGDYWACRWDAGVPTSLTQVSGADYSYVREINASGQIAGWSKLEPSDCATIWEVDGNPTTIPVPGVHGYGESLNDLGRVVGVSYQDWGGVDSGAWTWTADNGLEPLAELGGGEAAAWHVNNLGEIVGWASLPGGAKRACLWTGGSPADLGTLEADSFAFCINELSTIVGASAFDNGAQHAVIFDGQGGVQDLGTLGGHAGVAWCVAEDGRIIGWDETDNGSTHAFLYEEGTLRDLNDLIPEGSEWTLEYARGLNGNDWIVGSGMINGEEHAFLLAAVPEPATMLLLGTGVLGVLGVVRRKRIRSH